MAGGGGVWRKGKFISARSLNSVGLSRGKVMMGGGGGAALAEIEQRVAESGNLPAPPSRAIKAEPEIKPGKPLKISEIKEAVFKHFKVETADGLKQKSAYIRSLNFSNSESYKELYRRYIGVLPDERGSGRGFANGINIEKYQNRPLEAFGASSLKELDRSWKKLQKEYADDPRTLRRLESMEKSARTILTKRLEDSLSAKPAFLD